MSVYVNDTHMNGHEISSILHSHKSFTIFKQDKNMIVIFFDFFNPRCDQMMCSILFLLSLMLP